MKPNEKPSSKEVHVARMEAQLGKWGAKLDRLAAKFENVGGEAKAGYRKQIEESKEKYKDAQAKLSQFKAAGSENWEGFLAGIKDAWSDVEAAFKKLVS